jgi:protein-tyrosine phosphatase
MPEKHLFGSFQLPDGVWVHGHGLSNPLPAGPLPEYGLYLGSRRLRERHDATLTWRHDWLDWPDFLLPRDREQAVKAIKALHGQARTGVLAEVACGAGAGRTGTVLACLAVLAGCSPCEAIDFVRANHNHRAVETPWQRRWVQRFPTT